VTRTAYWTFWIASIVFTCGAMNALTHGFVQWVAQGFPPLCGAFPPPPVWETMSLFSILCLLALSAASHLQGRPHWRSTTIAVLTCLCYLSTPVF
jgi:hypothetical protein